MERGALLVRETERGTIAITSDAVAQIAGHVAAESYGIVAMRRRGLRRRRERLTDGITIRSTPKGLELDLAIVVEYGLNLAEVGATVRSRVAYEVERMTGLPVAAVEVRIEGVR